MNTINIMIFCKEDVDEKTDIIWKSDDRDYDIKVKPRPKILLNSLKKGDIIPSRHWNGLNIDKLKN